MAFGGGSFLAQNKVLPGVYVNVTQQSRQSSVLSERGVAAMGIELDWGPDGELFYMEAGDFMQNASAYLGYAYGDAALAGLRDLFAHVNGCWFYRLNSGAKAANKLCEAKYTGVRGNDLRTVVEVTEDLTYVVRTYLDGREVDVQAVSGATGLVDNDYVHWLESAVLSKAETLVLSGGSNKAAVELSDYEAMLEKLAGCSFNVLGCVSTDSTVKALLARYTKEQREENGRYFQTVLYRYAANYEGVISVENTVSDVGAAAGSLVYWVTGAEAGCAVNEALTNMVYDGEFVPVVSMLQSELKEALQQGKLVLHKVGDGYRVLEDVNTLKPASDTAEKRYNQTMRVIDQIIGDVSTLFYERYLGRVPNDASGRVSLWNDIVSYHRQLVDLRAIEDFEPEHISVEQGESRKAVVVSEYVTVTNAMSQLYLTVVFD